MVFLLHTCWTSTVCSKWFKLRRKREFSLNNTVTKGAVVRWNKQINYFDPFKVLFKGSCLAYLFTCGLHQNGTKPSYLEMEVRFRREFLFWEIPSFNISLQIRVKLLGEWKICKQGCSNPVSKVSCLPKERTYITIGDPKSLTIVFV